MNERDYQTTTNALLAQFQKLIDLQAAEIQVLKASNLQLQAALVDEVKTLALAVRRGVSALSVLPPRVCQTCEQVFTPLRKRGTKCEACLARVYHDRGTKHSRLSAVK